MADAVNGPFEQGGQSGFSMELRWTDRWIGGIAAMVSLDLATMQPICHYATPHPLHTVNQQFSLLTSVMETLSTQ